MLLRCQQKAKGADEVEGEAEEGVLTALNLDHLQGVFLILLTGLLLAAFTFLAERVWFPKNTPQQ